MKTLLNNPFGLRTQAPATEQTPKAPPPVSSITSNSAETRPLLQHELRFGMYIPGMGFIAASTIAQAQVNPANLAPEQANPNVPEQIYQVQNGQPAYMCTNVFMDAANPDRPGIVRQVNGPEDLPQVVRGGGMATTVAQPCDIRSSGLSNALPLMSPETVSALNALGEELYSLGFDFKVVAIPANSMQKTDANPNPMNTLASKLQDANHLGIGRAGYRLNNTDADSHGLVVMLDAANFTNPPAGQARNRQLPSFAVTASAQAEQEVYRLAFQGGSGPLAQLLKQPFTYVNPQTGQAEQHSLFSVLTSETQPPKPLLEQAVREFATDLRDYVKTQHTQAQSQAITGEQVSTQQESQGDLLGLVLLVLSAAGAIGGSFAGFKLVIEPRGKQADEFRQFLGATGVNAPTTGWMNPYSATNYQALLTRGSLAEGEYGRYNRDLRTEPITALMRNLATIEGNVAKSPFNTQGRLQTLEDLAAAAMDNPDNIYLRANLFERVWKEAQLHTEPGYQLPLKVQTALENQVLQVDQPDSLESIIAPVLKGLAERFITPERIFDTLTSHPDVDGRKRAVNAGTGENFEQANFSVLMNSLPTQRKDFGQKADDLIAYTGQALLTEVQKHPEMREDFSNQLLHRYLLADEADTATLHPSADVRRVALEALNTIADKRHFETILKAFRAETDGSLDPQYFQVLANTAERMRPNHQLRSDKEAMPIRDRDTFHALLASEATREQTLALSLLKQSRLKGPDSVPNLMAYLGTPQNHPASLREEAIQVMLQSLSLTEPVRQDKGLRNSANGPLNAAEQNHETLLEQLSSTDATARKAAVMGLQKLDLEGKVTTEIRKADLTRLFDRFDSEKDPSVIPVLGKAIIALGTGPDYLELLQSELVANDNVQSQIIAARALQANDTNALPVLFESLPVRQVSSKQAVVQAIESAVVGIAKNHPETIAQAFTARLDGEGRLLERQPVRGSVLVGLLQEVKNPSPLVSSAAGKGVAAIMDASWANTYRYDQTSDREIVRSLAHTPENDSINQSAVRVLTALITQKQQELQQLGQAKQISRSSYQTSRQTFEQGVDTLKSPDEAVRSQATASWKSLSDTYVAELQAQGGVNASGFRLSSFEDYLKRYNTFQDVQRELGTLTHPNDRAVVSAATNAESNLNTVFGKQVKAWGNTTITGAENYLDPAKNLAQVFLKAPVADHRTLANTGLAALNQGLETVATNTAQTRSNTLDNYVDVYGVLNAIQQVAQAMETDSLTKQAVTGDHLAASTFREMKNTTTDKLVSANRTFSGTLDSYDQSYDSADEFRTAYKALSRVVDKRSQIDSQVATKAERIRREINQAKIQSVQSIGNTSYSRSSGKSTVESEHNRLKREVNAYAEINSDLSQAVRSAVSALNSEFDSYIDDITPPPPPPPSYSSSYTSTDSPSYSPPPDYGNANSQGGGGDGFGG
ncbi:MAG: hypothetical protein SFZ03_09795 [Candidatus Melainabacteria bacterium]|nr:hypothetical protein [Candidatus Melainabacteria bacterium]